MAPPISVPQFAEPMGLPEASATPETQTVMSPPFSISPVDQLSV